LAARVRPDQVAPPSVVRCSHPATVGAMLPAPTQPFLSSRKNVAPSKTSSTPNGMHLQDAPPSKLSQ